jgi:hypothetical protein
VARCGRQHMQRLPLTPAAGPPRGSLIASPLTATHRLVGHRGGSGGASAQAWMARVVADDVEGGEACTAEVCHDEVSCPDNLHPPYVISCPGKLQRRLGVWPRG